MTAHDSCPRSQLADSWIREQQEREREREWERERERGGGGEREGMGDGWLNGD
jgi:hypothetical protein